MYNKTISCSTASNLGRLRSPVRTCFTFFGLAVITLAQKIKKTSECTKVLFATVVNWGRLKVRESIICGAATMRWYKPDKAKLLEMEMLAQNLIMGRQVSGKAVQYWWSFKCCKQAYKEAYPGRDPDEFCLSQWCFFNFCRQNWISARGSINVCQKLHKFYQYAVINQARFIRRNCRPEYRYLPPNCAI